MIIIIILKINYVLKDFQKKKSFYRSKKLKFFRLFGLLSSMRKPVYP